MRKNVDKVLFTSAVFLVFATLIVLVFAMWSETIKVNTFVNTGELDVSYDNINLIEGEEAEGKNVGNCNYVLDTSGDVDELIIIIENGYPGYSCSVYFDIVNTGTIPVIGPFYNISEIPEDLSLEFIPARLQQLHPGDKASYSIIVEVLQSANENYNYTVIIEITYIQWNEYTPPPTPEPTTAKISGYVWEDIDGDGYWDTDIEPPLANVTVYLMQDNIIISTTTTDECGYYEFIVSPGTYRIKPVLLQGYNFTTPSEIEVTVYPGQEYHDNNFGMRAPIPPPPQPELGISVDFRHTNTDFKKCPAKLGTPLNKIGEYYIVYATVPNKGLLKDKVVSISPGAFYYAMNISGIGITDLNITLTYDYQFDVRDGIGGKVRAYILNTTSGCVRKITEVGTLNYSIDNIINTVIINITLYNPLPADTIILIYIKYKPSTDLLYQPWDQLDKYFEVNHLVETDIGSGSGQSIIQIVKK